MNSSTFKTIITGQTLIASLLAFACSAPATDPQTDFGELSLALRTTVQGEAYELSNASFLITGTADVALQTDETNEGETLESELPVGEYSLELQEGWQLLRLSADGAEPLTATLVSANPQPFTIADGETTSVSYRFEFDGEELELGTGFVSITIDVAEATVRSVIFSELMSNPAELADSSGEWLELYNSGDDPVDLEGCFVERDSTSFEIAEPLTIESGQSLTLANSDAPGFTPDYVYSGVTLPNSAVFTLNLRCSDELLDSVVVDPSTWPGGAGIAVSLSSNASDEVSNDDPANWCDAASPYSTDLGSPGEPNPVCGG